MAQCSDRPAGAPPRLLSQPRGSGPRPRQGRSCWPSRGAFPRAAARRKRKPRAPARPPTTVSAWSKEATSSTPSGPDTIRTGYRRQGGGLVRLLAPAGRATSRGRCATTCSASFWIDRPAASDDMEAVRASSGRHPAPRCRSTRWSQAPEPLIIPAGAARRRRRRAPGRQRAASRCGRRTRRGRAGRLRNP